ncbi:Antiseptic resistance protein [Starkeya nomas]|uniref:Antiseptic resistance protein n=1 Tax=Starkeya nomas TaxID=2666134 RepID=A0A5S9PW96_9HYPH|nr:MFS transporter [Starkeya nomas]CAA0108764.1 Antiseptic resistance protein [Starkeya nomas]
MDTATSPTRPPQATPRDWIALAVIALPCLVYAMDLTVLNLAVPHLALDLAPSASQLLWIIDIYGFMVAGTLMLMGTLGDRIGRRKLLLIGAAAFACASVLAAMARSAEQLILARALLGIAGATLAPSTLSLIRNIFLDQRQRTFAIGVWIACFSSGATLGPLVGGVILTYFAWGAVFLAAVPVMIGLLIVGPLLLPEFRDENAGRLDIVSAVQSIVASLALIYGMKRTAESGFGWEAMAAIALGLAVGALFISRQRRLADPMIDLGLFRHPGLGAALAINVTAMLGAMGIFVFISQYLQLVLGMSPMEAGLWTAPSGVCFAIGSMATPQLVRRWRPVDVLSCGLVLASLGFLLLTRLGESQSLPVLMGAILMMCLGLSPVGTITTDLMMRIAPAERAGAASAISETSFEFGGALGIAVLGSLVAASYRVAMADVPLPGIPPEILAPARRTLDAAAIAADKLPEALAAPLREAAHAAFAHALDLAALACVGATLLALIIARTRLSRA